MQDGESVDPQATLPFNASQSPFVAKLEEQVPSFLEAVEAKLPFVKTYYADHVCWRTETMEDYQELVAHLRENAELLIESEIGGRPIATFQLNRGIPCRGGRQHVNVVEIPAPKVGSPYREGLEHVEFVIGQTQVPNETTRGTASPVNDATHQSMLQKMMEDHPQLNWNEKAKKKHVNPDVSVKVIANEIDSGMAST
eukprot:scaffold1356_cov123-Cylindrotheca_fusiformis.AAC.51